MERAAGSPGTGPGDARGQAREDRDRRRRCLTMITTKSTVLEEGAPSHCTVRTLSNTAYMSGQEAEEEDRHRDGPPPCAGGCLQTGAAAQFGGAAQARQQPGAGHGRGQGLVL